MSWVIAIVVGLVLAAIVYYVLALFLPYIIAILAAALVFLVVVFGGPRYYTRSRGPAV